MLEEFKDSKECIFLTLTYSDESVHYDGNVHKEHLQKFWKRLRKRLGSRQIRYYAVGEYGTKTFRPHYHAIVSGINANFYDILADAWSKGNIQVGTVTERSISYVCKYHVNRTDYPVGLNPSFVLMSKGIGKAYVEKFREYHEESIDRCYYTRFNQKKRLPRYFKDKVYTTQQKEDIMQNLVLRQSNLDAMQRWLSLHPNSNYFKDIQSRYEEFKRKFKEKSNFNDKL